MSWNQDYSVQDYLQLLIKLTGRHPEELLEAELAKKGILVFRKDRIVLADGYFADVEGTRVTLSDGRVFVPKLVEKFTENGNHGIDTYEYMLENEIPEVRYINGDDQPDDCVSGCSTNEYDDDSDYMPENPGWE